MRRHHDETSALGTTTTATDFKSSTGSPDTGPQSQSQSGYFKRSPSCSSLSINASSSSKREDTLHHHHRQHNATGTRTTSVNSTSRNATNDFDDVMILSSSPCGTPTKKRWEGAFNMFLRGKSQQQQHSPTVSSSPSSSITSVPIAEHDADEQSSTTTSSGGKSGLKGTKKKSSFSLLPGSRRLVSRNSLNKNMNMNNKPSSGLTSMFSKRGSATTATAFTNANNDNSNHSRNSSSNRKFDRGHKSMDELDVPLRKGIATLERTSSGPNSSSTGAGNSDPNSPNRHLFNSTRRRQHKPFSSSVPESTATTSLWDRREHQQQQQQQQQQTEKNIVSSSLSEQLMAPTTAAAAAIISTPSTNHDPTGTDSNTHLNRAFSIDWLAHPVVKEGVELPLGTVSAPSLTQLQPWSQSLSHSQSPQFLSSGLGHRNCNTDQHEPNHHLHMIPTQPPGHAISNHYRIPSSLTDYHDVGLNLDDSDNSHMDDNEQQRPLHNNNDKTNINITNVEHNCGIPEPPESLDEILGGEDIEGVVTVFSGSSSSYNNIFQHYHNHNHSSHHLNQQHQEGATSPETKKAFTKIHNSTEYGGGDYIVSPFLGGFNQASNLDLVGSVHNSYVSHDNAMLLGGRQQPHQQQHYYGSVPHFAASTTFNGTIEGQEQQQHENIYVSGEKADNNNNNPVSTSILSRSLPLEIVDELQKSSIKNNYGKGGLRLLKPIQGAESWKQGRRYLIAPAALASCPLSTIKTLTGSSTQSATEAATSSTLDYFPKASGMIVLGEAHMTYVGDKYHLTYGKWSSCRLVLRQNYLFEYDLGTPLASLPRGIVHLQHAAAYPHKDFQDALELHFYASPCAKVDHRILMIRVKKSDERDHWITCLNNAAKLHIKDIWEFDEDRPIGSGRYASIYSARRRQTASNTVNKRIFRETEDQCDYQQQEQLCDHNTNTYALKIIDKNEFWRLVIKGRERCDTIVRELAVQSTLTATFGTKYNNFLQLHGFFETTDRIVIEMELLDGKDLFEYISSKGVLVEEEAGFIVRDILVGLLNMKQIGIAHRDIKPANIFMTNESKYGTSVKLGDFGMSTLVGLDGLVRGRCGSPGYVAPEILMAKAGQGYGNQVDIFSAGVTLYVMLCGYEPLYGENEKELIEANKNAEIDYPSSEWGRISPEARDLVKRMLKRNPIERITAKEALQHDWIVRLKPKHKICHFQNTTAKSDSSEEEEICAVM